MTYIFNARANSYFNGQDVRVESTETHETILVNLKDDMWAVSVKDEETVHDYPADVQNALGNIPDAIGEALYEQATQEFWGAANDLAQEHGFTRVWSASHSGGWMAVAGTEDWEPTNLFEGDKDPEVARFLTLAFAAEKAIAGARNYFFDRVREAMGELQLELREYAEWVGAKVSSLDGYRFTIERLDVRDGHAIFTEKKPAKSFSFANEVNLLDKADSNLPFSECQGCGKSYPNDTPGHHTGCVIGALLSTLEDRGFKFAGTEISNIDADHMWESIFGPAADEIERVLEVNGEA